MTDSHFPASKSTIMVVDDNPELVNIVCVMLEKKEFNLSEHTAAWSSLLAWKSKIRQRVR